MIWALIFDLDGTLVQSERLKAQAYAIAVQKLIGLPEPDDRAVQAYRETVGATREDASRYVMQRLGLEDKLRPLMSSYGVEEPHLVLAAMRVRIYQEMTADPQVLRDNEWPNAVALLKLAKEAGCGTALATSSHADEAARVLEALGLRQFIDVVLTRDDVSMPKPDPEIYLTAAKRLGVRPEDCLVLEDSPTGVEGGLAAGMEVVAIATPFTMAGLHAKDLLAHEFVVHDPNTLIEVVRERIVLHNRNHGDSEALE